MSEYEIFPAFAGPAIASVGHHAAFEHENHCRPIELMPPRPMPTPLPTRGEPNMPPGPVLMDGGVARGA